MFWFRGALMWLGALLYSVGAPSPHIWKCPDINQEPIVECSCDMPHTLRCTGDRSALQVIGRTLRSLDSAAVSLLDCTIQNVTLLPGSLLEGVALHGLVISSGEINEIQQSAFQGLAAPLQALGLPNNQLITVPTVPLRSVPELDRLDLSGNKLKALDVDSFKGLYNLSFVDLSNNLINKMSPSTFTKLPQLRTLRLRGNHLTINAISKLDSILTVEELDISSNALVGPLDSHTFPKMQSLKYLQLAHNSFTSIKMGCLEGLTNLTALSLQHNQIDVIEDHAFIYVSKLIDLDLSHNRIVAVSGASLSHLPYLNNLDLRHNFLRALTPDLILPLKKLQSLRLDDNDISIVASDALKSDIVLKRLTLSENPLNCDCSLSEFALWLANSSLPKEDKASAVCTTPPTLENGLLVDIPNRELLCGDEDQEMVVVSHPAPVKAHINLRNFFYDGENIVLQWNVEEKAIPYTCDAIFVYEEEGPNEVLLESTPLKCNSSYLDDPRLLNVTVPNSSELIQGRNYRYCVVLLESAHTTDDLSLVLGCSDVMPLNIDATAETKTNNLNVPNVTAIFASIKPNGLKVAVVINPQFNCELDVAVFKNSGLLAQKRLDCNSPVYIFEGFCDNSYKVCANIVQSDLVKPVCIKVIESAVPKVFDISMIGLILILLSLTTGISFVTIVWVLFKNSRAKTSTHQCFMPPEGEEHQQHNKYIKLQATTKL
ncbi:hypothetical protein RN001_000385 [Aquatica leii]|uniref:LRRCT domain-containing protein n=1 Tax=Aquatica leii TaxID=1421715 RepID=A0AAN7SKI5_9COLE|nr:hypothetical protein RN001_000385 [Aquatica leii]